MLHFLQIMTAIWLKKGTKYNSKDTQAASLVECIARVENILSAQSPNFTYQGFWFFA
jgi:hypothetical protein